MRNAKTDATKAGKTPRQDNPPVSTPSTEAPDTQKSNAEGPIITVTLTNPDRLNAVNATMWLELRKQMEALSKLPDLRCIILRGAGDQAFASGGDIQEFRTARATVDDAMKYHANVVAALDSIRNCPIPTVAAIKGACMGGGLEIAASCDLRIAGTSARFGIPINQLGFSMYPEELSKLLELVSPSVALELLLEGRVLNAEEAQRKGLLTRVVADEAVFDDAVRTASFIAAGAPNIARWHKQWIHRLSRNETIAEAEKRASFAFLDTDDYREGLDAFLQKRKPVFKGS